MPRVSPRTLAILRWAVFPLVVLVVWCLVYFPVAYGLPVLTGAATTLPRTLALGLAGAAAAYLAAHSAPSRRRLATLLAAGLLAAGGLGWTTGVGLPPSSLLVLFGGIGVGAFLALRRLRLEPGQTSRAGETPRYKGTVPFQDLELDRKTFFGRDRESRSLRSLVLAERLVVLFSKSGMGKTSLINAGLVQPLREMRYLPLVVRLADRKRGPLASLLNGVRTAAQEAGLDIVVGDPSSVWSFFKTAEFWSARDDLLRPVLIVDQFEELFTLHGPELRREFISELAALVRGRAAAGRDLQAQAKADTTLDREPPDLKIVLSLREDFLADLEELAGAIPGILHKRFRLGPLSLDGAREAIVGPAALVDPAFDSSRFSYQEEVVDRIISFLARRRHGAEIIGADSVEPVQLQLICNHLEELVHARQTAGRTGERIEVSEADLGDEAQLQRVLEGFYDRTLAAIASPWERHHVRRLCEQRLISGSGRRLTEDEEEIERKQRVSRARLQELVNSRLLRPEPRLGGIYYELSHDTLVEPIQRSRKKRVLRRRLLAGGVLASLFVTCAGLRFANQERQLATQGMQLDQLTLVSVHYDKDTTSADKKLTEHLEKEVRRQDHPTFELELDELPYAAAIARLIDRSANSAFVARLTPYVFVVAERLGAEFDVVATYRSKAVVNGLPATDRRGDDGYTYRSYIVVNKEALKDRLKREIKPGTETRQDLEEYFRSFQGRSPPKFLYHNKLSTSSFFLPSVYFRDRGIIDLGLRTEDISKGREREVISSKELVRRVADADAGSDHLVAAVWDGTKAYFEGAEDAQNKVDQLKAASADAVAIEKAEQELAPLKKDAERAANVVFIALEQELPNDLLAVSASMPLKLRWKIRAAVEVMEPAFEAREAKAEDRQREGPLLDGDFLFWKPMDVDETAKARSALFRLRELVRSQVAQVTPVTVRISVLDQRGQEIEGVEDLEVQLYLRRLLVAAEDAVRLSGTEFVLWSESFEHADFDWTFQPIHEGAVVLTSEIGGLERLKQEFQISFKDEKDLTERVGDLIRSRMHRIRYVWPYSESDAPTILRDVDFSVPKDGTIQVQKIRWSNRETNHLVIEREFPARLVEEDARRFVLSGERFDEGLNPMGSVSYRVVLLRPGARSPISVMLERVKTFLIG